MADEATNDRISAGSLERLMRHDWPGNVRELRNVVAVALAFSKEGPIDLAANLTPMVASSSTSETKHTRGRTFQDAKRDVLTHFERDYFTALFAECGGNISEIARRSGMERAHVRGYLRRHGIGYQGRGGSADGGWTLVDWSPDGWWLPHAPGSRSSPSTRSARRSGTAG